MPSSQAILYALSIPIYQPKTPAAHITGRSRDACHAEEFESGGKNRGQREYALIAAGISTAIIALMGRRVRPNTRF
jgi:hypothetical protein